MARRRISARERSVVCSSGKATFCNAVSESKRALPWKRKLQRRRNDSGPPSYDNFVAPRAAQRAMIPVTVANPKVTPKPMSSEDASQPVFSSERMESKT